MYFTIGDSFRDDDLENDARMLAGRLSSGGVPWGATGSATQGRKSIGSEGACSGGRLGERV